MLVHSSKTSFQVSETTLGRSSGRLVGTFTGSRRSTNRPIRPRAAAEELSHNGDPRL